jgi:hypothetical protein
VIGDPDYRLEPMHYYLPNPTYFVRERRYGEYVRFTRKAGLELTLGDILDEARAIRATTGRRMVIVLAWRLGEMDPPRVYRESYVWSFSAPAIRSSDFGRRRRCWRNFPKRPAL